MAVPFVESFNGDGSSRIFTVINTILSESHVRVDYYYDDGSGFDDYPVSANNWDIINNSVVFKEAPTDGYVVKISVSSDGQGLDTAPSDITNIGGVLDDIVAVSTNLSDILTTAGLEVEIHSIADDKDTLDSIYGDKATIDSIFADKAALDSIFADKATLDSLYADKTKLDSLYNYKATLDSIYADKVTLDSLYTDKITLDSLYADKIALDRIYTSIDNVNTNANNIANIDIVADNISDVNTVSTDIASVNTVAADLANVNTTAGSIASVDATATNISSVNIAATNISDVSTVADNILDVNTVADNIGAVQNTSAIKADISTVASVSTNVTTVAGVSGNVTAIANSIASVNTNAINIDDINSVATTVVPNIDEILLADNNAATATIQAGIAITQATNASSSATQAQLFEWEAEAERLTADSYATEAEDVFVKTYSSDGDGTFTATNTTEYSALHWAAKSEALSSGLASNISITDTGGYYTSTEVETALQEIGAEFTGIYTKAEQDIIDGMQDAAIGLKAPLASPALTGTPTAPTAVAGDNSTKIATTAFVNSEISNNGVLKTSVQALHATDALRISGSTLSLYKGNGGSESVVIPSADIATGTAALSGGGVGTYCMACEYANDRSAKVLGSTLAGSSLKPVNIGMGAPSVDTTRISAGSVLLPGSDDNASLVGTWRLMGAYGDHTGIVNDYPVSLWLRIS